MPRVPVLTDRTKIAAPVLNRPIVFDVKHGKTSLRTAQVSDASQTMADWLSDPAVVLGLNSTGKPISVADLRTYIGGFDQNRRNLALIFDVVNGRALGLMMFDIEPRHLVASFHVIISKKAGLRIDDSYHAIRLLMRHLFTQRRVEKVCIEPLSRNTGVVRSCQWFGFELEGVLKAHRSDTITGARLDQHMFGLTKANYKDWPHR